MGTTLTAKRFLCCVCLSAALSLPCLSQPAGGKLLAPLSNGEFLDLPALNTLDEETPNPADFLGYSLGSQFTHHSRILDYLDALAAASDRVTLWDYGVTYEGRPLRLVAISSPANIAKLEEIRQKHARLARPEGLSAEEQQVLVGHQPAFVWLAYGVHGNESSSTEAAIATAYTLAAAGSPWDRLLEGVVVFIDPVTNPDGRERYVHFYESRRGRQADPYRAATEHWEPWPGGRQNHYLIDLNRDWSWATQRETQSRLVAYQAWEPQVYVDFHEMGADSTYFFPPSSEPIHPQIDPKTVAWLDVFGRANAAAFDSQGWVYYKGERFDLFYPGYGDSYPSLRDAVGMTYEVAGHSFAGAALVLDDGRLLTLADRIARHFTTGMATVKTAATHRGELLDDFTTSRHATIARAPTTYLWSPDGEGQAAGELLSGHGIEVRQLAEPLNLKVRPHGQVRKQSQAQANRFSPGTLLVSTDQPLGKLVQALMKVESPMAEEFVRTQRQRIEANRLPEFYDITAWSIPMAFNLETWVFDGGVENTVHMRGPTGLLDGQGTLGYLTAPQGLATYRLAARLLRHDIRFRVALHSFKNEGRTFPSGTLFIPRQGNPGGPDELEQQLESYLTELPVRIQRIETGYAEEGISLGSDLMVAVRPPRIGLLSGEGVGTTSFGSLWHLLDQQVEIRHHRINIAHLSDIDLSELDVLVMPDGCGYRNLPEAVAEQLDRWIHSGGILVAIDGAISWLQKNEMTEISSWKPEDEDPKNSETFDLTRQPVYTPGAVLHSALRSEHPLAAGLARSPKVLFQGTTILRPTGDPRQDVLVAGGEDPVAAGFAWPEAKERLKGALLVGTESRGKGALVLFAQEPDFRLFWRATAPLFLNAVIYGPSLASSGAL